MNLRALRSIGIVSVVASVALPATAFAGPAPQVPYDNGRWDFHLDYPVGWSPTYGEDGAGVLLVKGGQAMAVGALYAIENDQRRPTLTCDPSGIDPLIGRGLPQVTNKRVIAQRSVRFRGFRSCWSMLTYSISGNPYEGRYFSLLRHGLQYDFSVECKVNDCPEVTRQYRALLKTFRFGND
jgi:hypothetical protein